MSYPSFLNVEQIMDILMAELPNGVYAEDRADNPNPDLRSYSSSELRAHAQMFAASYQNLQTLFLDKFITTATDSAISSWEILLFSTAQDSSQTIDQRRQNLLTKFRATGGISYQYIYNIIYGILNPLGINFDLVNFSGFNNGAWILDDTELDVGTYLSSLDPLEGAIQNTYILDCNAIINGIRGDLALGGNVLINVTSTSNIEIGAGITGTYIPSGTTVLSTTSTTITMSQNATGNQTQGILSIQNYIAAGLTSQDFSDIQQTAYTAELRIYGNALPATLSLLNQTLTQIEKAGSTFKIINNFPYPPPDPNFIDMGVFTGDTLIDAIDCGSFLVAGATYDVWDFGGF